MAVLNVVDDKIAYVAGDGKGSKWIKIAMWVGLAVIAFFLLRYIAKGALFL